jgi:ArsR family transcriptional regulator
MDKFTCEDLYIHQDQVEIARRGLVSETQVNPLAEFFKALGDPTRLRIISALSATELCVYDLAALLEMSPSAVSHQLRLLRALGLVKYRKAGKHVYYQLDDEHVQQVFVYGQEHIAHQQG